MTLGDLLIERGPMTGAQLQSATGRDAFDLWRASRLDRELYSVIVGQRYVRLDIQLPGYERLSPSIQREFADYTVIGHFTQRAAVEERAEQVRDRIAKVTHRKLLLAGRIVDDVCGRYLDDPATAEHFCVVVAGDIAYGMSHEVPRPERSTGVLVNGSDLDLVVLLSDDAPEGLAGELDDRMYKKKFQLLRNPAHKEEIDYIVKNMATLEKQSAYDTFQHMVASKIFIECQYLRGSEELFQQGKELMRTSGALEKLRRMRARATEARIHNEERLLASTSGVLDPDELVLFRTAEESEEFE
ncbi:hypothetical protein [Enemella sp. A6]|uniref:hypothetical protein n=1 Tax=Enemella sp. A6 TaxID=3440152 RepID=UPI003EB99DA6